MTKKDYTYKILDLHFITTDFLSRTKFFEVQIQVHIQNSDPTFYRLKYKL